MQGYFLQKLEVNIGLKINKQTHCKLSHRALQNGRKPEPIAKHPKYGHKTWGGAGAGHWNFGALGSQTPQKLTSFGAFGE